MGFWIFIFVCSMLMPVLMIIFGQLFQKRPPGQINSVYGYRTKMSMLNMDTWDYAHRYFGTLWLRIGLLLLLLTGLSMILAFGKSDTVVGVIGGVIETIQVLMLFVPIALTEQELRRRFGADGSRK